MFKLPFLLVHQRPDMASFEDYDEFGNYIGADLDSDDEEDISQPYTQQQREPSAQPLEGFEDEPMEGVDEGTLMQVDGASLKADQFV